MQQPWNPLSWASEHWTQIGIVSAASAALYKIYRVALKIKTYSKSFVTSQESIELIKTNHLPHLQAELEKANCTLTGIREDNRELRADLRALLTKGN